MKVKFWLDLEDLIIVCLGLCFFGLCTVVSGAMISVKTDWYVLTIVFGVLFLANVFAFFLIKKVSSKVSFSHDGIEWTWFKKQIVFISWDDVTEVKETWQGRSKRLSFFNGDKEIQVCFIRKKMYDAIMILCPYQNIKNEINNMRLPVWFKKNDSDDE